MTICIAALCRDENGQAIVAVADRMQAWNGLLYEGFTNKIVGIAPSVVALIGKEALVGNEIVRNVSARLAGARATTDEAADATADVYLERRTKALNEVVGRYGLTFKDFSKSGGEGLGPQYAYEIWESVRKYDLDTELLVAGVDADGKAHLRHICNPGGDTLDCDATGFALLGGGIPFARNALVELGQSAAADIRQTLLTLYVAKKRAEVVSGVGVATDCVVVRKDGVERLDADAVRHLQDLHVEHHDLMITSLTAAAAKLRHPGAVPLRPKRHPGPGKDA